MKTAITIAILLAVLIIPLSAAAAGENSSIDEQESVETSLRNGTNDILDSLDLRDIGKYYSEFTPFSGTLDEALENISENGLSEITIEGVLEGLRDKLTAGIASSGKYIVEMILMLLCFGILSRLGTSFTTDISKTAGFAGYIMICVISASMLGGSIIEARTAIERLSGVTEAVTPILIALLAAMGGITSSALLSPTLAALTGGIFEIVRQAIFPAILVSAAITIISNVSGTLKLSKFSQLIDSAVGWTMGIISIIFVGICSLKGFSGAAIDGISIKTAKFAVDKMVPVVGGLVSDTLDTMLACGLIVKNAVGTVSLILIVLMMASPLIMLLINIFLFKVGAAVAEPLAGENSAKMLTALAKVTTLLFATVTICTAMAFISTALLIGAANNAAALR